MLDQELHTKEAGEGSPQTTGLGDRAGDLEAPFEGQISGSQRREEEGSALHGQMQTCPPKGSWRESPQVLSLSTPCHTQVTILSP